MTALYCGECLCWDNAINNLDDYQNTDADIGNGFCEMGICLLTKDHKYFDNKCGTKGGMF
jgi:hypothetical protein